MGFIAGITIGCIGMIVVACFAQEKLDAKDKQIKRREDMMESAMYEADVRKRNESEAKKIIHRQQREIEYLRSQLR